MPLNRRLPRSCPAYVSFPRPSRRGLAAVASIRKPKAEGSIASVFTTLSGGADTVFPPRFAELKKQIWRDELVESWREVLDSLNEAVEEVATKGADIIPRFPFADIRKGLSSEQIAAIKKTGVVIITGGVPKEEALAWKQSLKTYVADNAERVKGFPPENVQVYEVYNSKAQTLARTHPALIESQLQLLNLWHVSDRSTKISLRTPISYYDRFRIRSPGDSSFVLGPHIDGGSIERWEDPQFRSCFKNIFAGKWTEHDPFDASPRINSNQDLYDAANQCTVFRPWQGWTSLSTTGPSEGTLRVCPMLPLASAYLMLRPFFRPQQGRSLRDWVPDLESTAFPGSVMGKTQELNPSLHPHLQLERTMVSAPKVEPGDQIFWHCDVIHAVEGEHTGKNDSSVLYIPAVPLTVHNADYLRDQRNNFIRGLPAPDFPGGEGESQFINRGAFQDIASVEGKRMLGFLPFEVPEDASEAEAQAIAKASELLL
ncbi:hypothetical protein EW146_g264 [Bondarzewia mesenterica]|uniref:DUF1479 domain protein n=1 Tax=Bondarzewia mesenterica TaxID=1095465 RepID=A0A4S4M9U4_9AGAM|nr:hypothetical protein EW146_g264 [Bondarzewia mesenterica]